MRWITYDPGTLTTNFDDVFHLTIKENGSAWLTGTSAGKAVLVPDDPSLPTYTAQFANYFAGDTLTDRVLHFTSNIETLGSDGSHLKFHGNGVVELNANGVLTVHARTPAAEVGYVPRPHVRERLASRRVSLRS